MSIFNKLFKFFGLDMLKLTFIAKEQEDGYTFIYSPELNGFTLMLAPEQTKNIGTLINAIHDPLMIYMTALCRARNKAKAKAKALKMKDFGETSPHSYMARLCSC
jgi:hypothetical protein